MVYNSSNSTVSLYSHSFYITVEKCDVGEPVRKKPRLDTDRDSAMGLSVFTGGTSNTFSEASLLNFKLCISDTVIIQILRMIEFNVRNSISGIYHESNTA